MGAPPGGTAPPPSGLGVPAGDAFIGREGDGNQLEHARAMACGSGDHGASPPRLWRLTAAQYFNTVQSVLGGYSKLDQLIYNPFQGADNGERFSNLASSFSIPDLTLNQLVQAAEVVAKLATTQLKGYPCITAPALDPACLGRLVNDVGAKAYRRPLRPEEASAITGLITTNQPRVGTARAVELGLQALLSSPAFVFRTELGGGSPDARGRTKLTPYEVASALSYSVTDAPPDELLLRAAAQGALGTPEQIRPHVQRLLGTGSDRASALQFFREYFHYDAAIDVFKDPKLFKFHDGPALVDETDAFVRDLLATPGGRLWERLLTSRTGFVTASTFESYSLPQRVSAKQPTKVELPAGQRAGMLTQPSFLVAFSHAEENDPIRRGKFVSESFLCRSVPALPIDVVPALPDLGPNATLRERLKAHSEKPNCAVCHRLMDPIGLGFEAYDHTGRYRTTESGKPADARGELTDLGMDGPFNGATELATRLAAAPRARQCFVRHVFRYWLGRNELPTDACTLAAADQEFARTGDFAQLVTALLSSDSFLYRMPSK